MLYEALARGQDFELHYAVKSRGEAAFLKQLETEFGTGVKVYAADEGVRLNVPALLMGEPKDQLFYVCGPAGLIEAAVRTAQEAGLDEHRVRYERFHNVLDQGPNRAITVTLARSRKVIKVNAESSILDVVQSAGISAAASCRIGDCGMCAVKVLAGSPDHRDDVLSKEQRDGDGLMCICVSRANGDALTLDL